MGKRHKVCLRIAYKYCIQIVQFQTSNEWERGTKFVCKLHTNIVFKSSNFKHQMNGKGAQSLFANCIQYCVRKAYNQLFRLPPHTIPNNFLREFVERSLINFLFPCIAKGLVLFVIL